MTSTTRRCCAVLGCMLMAATALGEVPVQPGDLAFGLSVSDPNVTLEQVRAGSKVGNWTALGFPQAVEFDNTGGILHNAAGNLLALNYGTGTLGGYLYNYSTNGSDAGEKIFDFDGSSFGLTKTRIGGLGVSPDNGYVSAVGYDTGRLIVLEYNAGTTGAGAGATISDGWESAAVFPTFDTTGSTWLDANTILVYAGVNGSPGTSRLYTVSFNGVTLGTPTVVATITSGNSDASMFSDVEYNPFISPYVFCHLSSFDGTTVNTLTVINPIGWGQVDQATYNTSMNTGREIALGPDRKLYVSQYAKIIDQIDITVVPGLVNDNSVTWYTTVGNNFNGIDVALGEFTGFGACCDPNDVCTIETEDDCINVIGGTWLGDGTSCGPHTCDPTGACCVSVICTLKNEFDCLAAGGTWLGEGTSCDPNNPCLFDMTIAEARALGPFVEVQLAPVIVASTTDLVASGSYKSITLQDATGGITVFGENADIDTILGSVGEGDEIRLVGRTDEFNCLFQLGDPFGTPQFLNFVGVPAPQQVFGVEFEPNSPTAESYESELVVVKCVTIAQTPNGKFQFGDHQATDPTGSFVLRVSTSDLDIYDTPIPTNPVDVVGIFSQYDTSGGCNQGYQLQVRGLADVTPTTDPNCGDPFGACCDGATCTIETEDDCINVIGGVYIGDGVACAPDNPCVGACCLNGVCTVETEDDCINVIGGEFIGGGTNCDNPICPQKVVGGDIALGLSTFEYSDTAHHIRAAAMIGAWTKLRYVQSVEFDSAGGVLHNANGNLLAMNFGAGGGVPGSGPTCTDPNRPQEGGKLYSLATNGTNGWQLLWDFNSLTGNSAECTRTGGLGVSTDNAHASCWGYDTKHLYVLEYNAGATPGTGSGASVSGESIFPGPFGFYTPATGTFGTTWLDGDDVLLYMPTTIPGSVVLFKINFSGGVFTIVDDLLINHPTGGGSQYSDVEYNPDISPYIFCMYSDFTSPNSTTYLTVVDPGPFTQLHQIEISGSCETGREIGLGPDGFLYISQYAGAGTPRTYIDRIDTTAPLGWVNDSTVDYYAMASSPVYSPFNGMDVAFSPGLCAGDASCDDKVDFGDINPFVDAMLCVGAPDPQACWDGLYPGCPFLNNDINLDDVVSFGDINPFVDLLISSSLPIICP